MPMVHLFGSMEGDCPASVSATPTATHLLESTAAASGGLRSGTKQESGWVSACLHSWLPLAIAFFLRRKKRQGARVLSQDQPYMGDASYVPTYGQDPCENSAYQLGAQ